MLRLNLITIDGTLEDVSNSNGLNWDYQRDKAVMQFSRMKQGVPCQIVEIILDRTTCRSVAEELLKMAVIPYPDRDIE